MSVAEVLDEVALSLQLALEAETAAMGRDADAGTERRQAWQLILEKLDQQLSVEHLRHWTVFVAEAGDVDLVGEPREALGLTGGIRQPEPAPELWPPGDANGSGP